MSSNYSCPKFPGKGSVAHPQRDAEDAVLQILLEARPLGTPSAKQAREALTALGLDADRLSRILFHESVCNPFFPDSAPRPALVIPLLSADERIRALYCLLIASPGSNERSSLIGGWTWGKAAGLTARLDDPDPEDPCLALCSDVLSGMAVRQALDLPVWTAVSLTCLPAAELPPHVFDLHLFLSRHPSGGCLIRRAADRHASPGRRIFVHLPDPKGGEPGSCIRSFLDVLRDDGEQAIRRSLQRSSPFQVPGRRFWPQPLPIEGVSRSEEAGMRSILRWIRRSGARLLSGRQVQRVVPYAFSTAQSVQAALNGLAARNWIRLCEPPFRTGPGRPPGARYEVNPRVFEGDPPVAWNGGRDVQPS